MIILPIKKPCQTSKIKSSDLEYVEFYEEYNPIDNIMETKQYIPEWCVREERTKPQTDLKVSNGVFMDWLRLKESDIIRLNKKLVKNDSDFRYTGIDLYDIGPMVQEMYLYENEEVKAVDWLTFYVRYDYIRAKI